MTQTEMAISVRGLTKTFGKRTVVDHFDMEVPKGAIYGFLGPNGSGKTTTIRMMCGLLIPDGGEGSCLGYDILTESHAIKENVGYMTQRFSLYEDLTIRENLDFIARMFRMNDRRKHVDQALADLGLADRAGQLAGTLSGGWKQRLSLAACMIHKPRLLMLDEPTAGVDPKARRDFWTEIRRLAASGVQVNAIAPGYIATNNTAALQADATRSRQILERIPTGRWGSPQDIAGAAVFLASPASDYVTGHVLAVDGGWLAR